MGLAISAKGSGLPREANGDPEAAEVLSLLQILRQ